MSNKRKSFDVDKLEEKYLTVKCGLHKKCLNQQLFVAIQDDVAEISRLTVEVSVYLHYKLSKEWSSGHFPTISFLDYFYALCDKSKAKYDMDLAYKSIRGEYISKKYNHSYRSNLLVFAAKQYETIFSNNIWMHAYTRLRRFLYQFEKNKTVVYQMLDFLFNQNSKYSLNMDLYKIMREHLKFSGCRFLHIKEYPLAHLRFFYNLQRYNEQNELKNFSLIPIYKHGLLHIRYDTFALYQRLCGLKLFKGSHEAFHANRREYWLQYFKLPKLGRKQFDYSITTDGITISFSTIKLVPKGTQSIAKKLKRTSFNNNPMTTIRQKLQENYFDSYVGLDPGEKLILGGVRIDQGPSQEVSRIKIKSKRFKYMASDYARNEQRKKTTSKIDKESESTVSPNQLNFIEYTKHRLKWFMQRQAIYSKLEVVRLKFLKYINTAKVCHVLAKEICQNKKVLICIGSTKTAANSPIRGYVRTPKSKLLLALQERAHVMEVNEFRTTKLCSSNNCYHPVNTSKSPHRYQFCPKCNTSWNRDVNAGNNILSIGLCHLFGRPVPQQFNKKNACIE